MTVQAITGWPTNGHLILACRDLGYLSDRMLVLDPTYGRGTFWKLWRPPQLIVSDLAATDPAVAAIDFRSMPYDEGTFDAVTFDPPYKLNGTPSVPDARYGVDVVRTREERHQLIRDGIDECARVLKPAGWLLVKCQDQVNSGRVWWQTRIFADHAEQKHGLRLVDSLLMLGGRPQPEGRSQVHARRNYSTMLVMRDR